MRVCCFNGNAVEDGEEEGLESGDELVPATKLKEAESRVRDLERALGRKAMGNEIPHETVRVGGEYNSSRPPNCVSWTVEQESHLGGSWGRDPIAVPAERAALVWTTREILGTNDTSGIGLEVIGGDRQILPHSNCRNSLLARQVSVGSRNALS